jgi:hypothetical protein
MLSVSIGVIAVGEDNCRPTSGNVREQAENPRRIIALNKLRLSLKNRSINRPNIEKPFLVAIPVQFYQMVRSINLAFVSLVPLSVYS